jgi:glycosyltransferase involved in cell wall biosynthesis
MTALVSVVTPFYNTAQYLGRCIESVVAQTWNDFEYLLVNNQSTDGSADIARAWGARDSRIRVIDQPAFLGQLENYNSALGHIGKGARYVKIVQADDWLYPECLASMVRVADLDPEAAIVGSYHLWGTSVLFAGLPIDTPIHEGREVCRAQLRWQHYFMGNPTTLLYRADLVRARVPFFEPGRYHADGDVCFDVLRTRRLGFVPQVLSFVRAHNEGITSAHEDHDYHTALRYTMVKHWGPEYLTGAEYTDALGHVTGAYWRALGLAALKRRGMDYWTFHRTRLAEIGERIWWPRVALGAAQVLLRVLIRDRP